MPVEISTLAIELPGERLGEADALLELLGAVSITHRPASDEAVLEPQPGTTPPWQRTRVLAMFDGDRDLEPAANLLRAHFGTDAATEVARLPETDWRSAVEAQPRELRFGRRLTITSAASSLDASSRTVVRLEAGLGFGTGEHPTTALCLEWLESELEPGCSVLDYGCGSGILAVAALRLGARRAWAADIEPQAIEATLANAALNRVSDRIWVGDPDALPTRHADVVLANILAKPLIELAPRLAALTAPAGTVVLTGILAAQAAGVRDAYTPAFAEIAEIERDGWTRLVGRRRREESGLARRM